MTGWHIRAGYSSRATPREVDNALKMVIAETRADINGLINEANGDSLVTECIMAYPHSDDATLTERIDEDGRYECMLLASGGGEWREAKEAARRAFVRVVMRRMHARRLDVSVVVA